MTYLCCAVQFLPYFLLQLIPLHIDLIFLLINLTLHLFPFIL